MKKMKRRNFSTFFLILAVCLCLCALQFGLANEEDPLIKNQSNVMKEKKSVSNTVTIYPKSFITNMEPEGYMANKLLGFLNAWVPDALDKNPELIEAVVRANHSKERQGTPYDGGLLDQNVFFGKHLAGLAYCYRATGEEMLLDEGRKLLKAIDEARGKTGYLGVHFPGDRLGGNGNWDVWGQYQAIHGLYQWYKTTDDQKALDIALDAANYCLNHFSVLPYPMHLPSIAHSLAHAYALLYQEVGDERFLKEAQRIVDEEWPKNGNWLNNALEGKEFYQHDVWRSRNVGDLSPKKKIKC